MTYIQPLLEDMKNTSQAWDIAFVGLRETIEKHQSIAVTEELQRYLGISGKILASADHTVDELVKKTKNMLWNLAKKNLPSKSDDFQMELIQCEQGVQMSKAIIDRCRDGISQVGNCLMCLDQLSKVDDPKNVSKERLDAEKEQFTYLVSRMRPAPKMELYMGLLDPTEGKMLELTILERTAREKLRYLQDRLWEVKKTMNDALGKWPEDEVLLCKWNELKSFEDQLKKIDQAIPSVSSPSQHISKSVADTLDKWEEDLDTILNHDLEESKQESTKLQKDIKAVLSWKKEQETKKHLTDPEQNLKDAEKTVEQLELRLKQLALERKDLAAEIEKTRDSLDELQNSIPVLQEEMKDLTKGKKGWEKFCSETEGLKKWASNLEEKVSQYEKSDPAIKESQNKIDDLDEMDDQDEIEPEYDLDVYDDEDIEDGAKNEIVEEPSLPGQLMNYQEMVNQGGQITKVEDSEKPTAALIKKK